MDVGGELCPKTAQREIFLVFVKCDRSVRSTQKTESTTEQARKGEGERRERRDGCATQGEEIELGMQDAGLQV